jgi:hypothetical protein
MDRSTHRNFRTSNKFRLAKSGACNDWKTLWQPQGTGSKATSPDRLVETMQGRLRELGCVEGRDISFEFQWAEGKLERFPRLSSELVGLKLDIITALSTPAALAAQKATTTIPIVFSAVGDPVGTGLVSNLVRPGGNVTGLSMLATEARRSSSRAADEIRAGDQPKGRQGARPHGSALASRACRRCDRITSAFDAVALPHR